MASRGVLDRCIGAETERIGRYVDVEWQVEGCPGKREKGRSLSCCFPSDVMWFVFVFPGLDLPCPSRSRSTGV